MTSIFIEHTAQSIAADVSKLPCILCCDNTLMLHQDPAHIKMEIMNDQFPSVKTGEITTSSTPPIPHPTLLMPANVKTVEIKLRMTLANIPLVNTKFIE